MSILQAALEDTQCGGWPGMGADHATHTVLSTMQAMAFKKRTCILASIDLYSAFYTILKEFIVVASGQCRRSGALPMLLGTEYPSC